MSLFREGLYFCNLEGSLLTVSYLIPEAVLTEYTRHRVLFLSQAGTYIDHLRREITLSAIALSEDLGSGLHWPVTCLEAVCHWGAALPSSPCNMGIASSQRNPSVLQSFRRCSAFPQNWEDLGNIYTVKMRSFPRPQHTTKVQLGKIHSLGIKTMHCGPVFPVTALKTYHYTEGAERMRASELSIPRWL